MSKNQYNLSSVMVVKRSPRKLPSIAGHFVRALAFFVIVLGVAATLAYLLSDPSDAIAKGEVRLDPVPLPPAADGLNGTSEALPDLLANIVPEGQNPTENFDALGNPIGRPNDNPRDLAGVENNEETATPPPVARPVMPQSSGPKTILIDGRPLDGAKLPSPLVKAPIANLSRVSPFGRIPTLGPNGQKAVTAYARPFTPPANKATVSLIIGGLGIDRALTRRIINETPPEVTLSFAAHTTGLQNWIDQARARGHEVLLELPMESQNADTAEVGADNTLRTSVSAGRNIRSLDWLMSRGQGYFAVTNYNGDKLVTRTDALAPILAHLSDAGLGMIYDGSTPAPALSVLSASANLPYTQAFTLVDVNTDSLSMELEFRRLETRASSGVTPIGVGFAYGSTLDAVKAWVQTLPEKDIVLAPASYVLNGQN